MKINNENSFFYNNRELLIFLSVFSIGILIRLFFGLYRPTEDLSWYVDLNKIQLSRIGIQKQFLFYPLRIINSEEGRIIAIGVITSLLNTIALKRLINISNQKFTIFIGILSIFSVFFAQIDMHLVRQQISIYFFIISITSRSVSIKSLIFAILAILYHEGSLLLFCAWTIALVTYKFGLNSIKSILFVFSLISNLFVFISISDPSIIFMTFISIAHKFTKNEINKNSLNISFYFFQILIFLLFIIPSSFSISKFISPETITRLVGFGVSYGLLLIISSGKFQRKGNFIKQMTLLILLSSYGITNFF